MIDNSCKCKNCGKTSITTTIKENSWHRIKALEDPFILKKTDHFEWIHQHMKSGSFTVEEVRKLIDELVETNNKTSIEDPYTIGYNDGRYALSKNSILWADSAEYQKGWEDGSGDCLMED